MLKSIPITSKKEELHHLTIPIAAIKRNQTLPNLEKEFEMILEKT